MEVAGLRAAATTSVLAYQAELISGYEVSITVYFFS